MGVIMKKYHFIIIITCLIFSQFVLATPPKPFYTHLNFPDQGEQIQKRSQVLVNISGASEWQSGLVKIKSSAIKRVVPASTVSNIKSVEEIPLSANQQSFSIPLTIMDNGEYEITISILLQNAQGVLSRSSTIGVLAENGLVWFGNSSIETAVESKIRYQVKQDKSLSPTEIEQQYQSRLNAEEQRRIKQSRANAGLTLRSSRVKKITKGDKLTITALWTGLGTGKLGTNAGDTNFKMHGTKVTFSDKVAGSTPDITGYFVDGQFSFTAPRDDYSYKMVIETTFSGIKADGSIDTTGNGIGKFQVVKQTKTGAVYTCEADNKISVTCNKAFIGDKPSSAFVALHGVAEMVVQAKKQLNVNKTSNFKVIFDRQTGISSYNSDKNINLLLLDRYDWDVVAHEFGHAIADETNAVDTNTGGSHNGSNQYDYASNASTLHNKSKSLELAISEGFGTWFGGALMQNPSARYNGKFKNIADGKYDDTEDTGTTGIHEPFEKNDSTAYFGEDTEDAMYRLLWDLMDSNADKNIRATCTACKDSTNLGLTGLWQILNASKVSNVIEFYKKVLDKKYNTKVSDLLIMGENKISDTGLKGALNIAYTFAEFGIAPYLEKPAEKTKLDLIKDKSGPKFEWSQKKTGTLKELDKFTLALYTADLKTLVFKKTALATKNYTLSEADIIAIRTTVDGLSTTPTSLISVVIGENSLAPNSGPYVSNPIEVLISNVNRRLVVVVDSSGSNSSTDPKNIRIDAAKTTLKTLISLTEAQATNTVPDLAGAIDFDSSVKVLSQLDDPDKVIPKLNSIDSSGGTDIAGGINSAVQILEAKGLVKDKSSIVVFTDGQNNAGPTPVIQAIVNATAKGIRTHYGFLQPFVFKKSKSIPSDAPAGYVAPLFATKRAQTLPATIEEAVLASGGVYAAINDAESQVVFIDQIDNKGFTNSDSSADSGGQTVIGQTQTADVLSDPLLSRSFIFTGQVNEEVQVNVDAKGNFIPFVKIIDKDGNIIAVDNDADLNGKVQLKFTLPYTGDYHVEVTSQDGNTGLFNIFIDVQNNKPAPSNQNNSVPIPTLSQQGIMLLILILLIIVGYQIKYNNNKSSQFID